ncbi:P-loop NTPase family protein [Halobacillus mangrovi]|uniref:Topology modulation protein n=1 Tax=Halobacillus mangrovi TaxID=402384 RepID=A0A1W6A0K6_9BACI|nr:topology modulation protein [Halobacillus mangrovi]ARI79049.1 topology modulation protein [Halobacillus mangrovi]
MKRIMVMGVSAGAGKSTFARKLGEKLGINVYHLDRFYWEPGWKEASVEDFTRRQQEAMNQEEWILEGNYQSTYRIRADKADTIIYIDMPLSICLYRVFKRWLIHRGKSRPDLGEGCPDKLDFEFIKFIVTTYHARKKKMYKRLQDFQEIGGQKKVIALKGRKAVKTYLENL